MKVLRTSSVLKMLMLVAFWATAGRSWLPTSITTGMPASAMRFMRRANSR